ncbi:cyclin-A2-1-like [Phragmites australis]|uniref:cyclin-A2-1-like n=1 Tax=Phragmites australis TaxID=29695 RepID=UPI002D7A1675|nr:cyclin-A2-1-like [Phragmites australis]
MAARKENRFLTACQATSGRVTRAQAAASRGRFGAVPSVTLPAKTERKLAAKGKTKRGASDENTSASTAFAGPQPKRRTVLKDVTNVSCSNSNNSCTVATKLQARPSQRVGRVMSKNKQCAKKVPKIPPPVVNRSSVVNDSNIAEETQYANILAPKQEPTVLFENGGSLSLQNIERNRDSACHDAFFGARNVRDEPQLSESKIGDSPALNIVDIDKDNGNPQMCTSYVADIYSNLMASELMRRPSPNYMEILQRDITKGMRGILIDWLIEVSEEYKLVPDTLYLTVYLIDRFLSRNYIERQKLQLLGITSMLVASKYEEICAPRVEEFCFITDNTYTKAEVLKMECQVLNDLGFHLSVPTTKTFLRRFLRAAQASRKTPSITMGFLANYLAELTLIDYGFLKFLPSIVAASAVFLASWTLDQADLPWNDTLEHYTSYKSSDIQTCVCALRELQHNTSNCPLNVIREKYRQQKYECVANLTSPELLQSLFS